MSFCGLTFPRFSKKTTRVRPVISAPILNSTDRMEWRGPDHNIGNKSDSGIIYLVPHPSGAGKHLVKRPRSPQTQAPLDDNFDAISQTQVGTFLQTGEPPVPRAYRVQPPGGLPPPPRRPALPSIDTFFGGGNQTTATSPLKPSTIGTRPVPEDLSTVLHPNAVTNTNSTRSKGKAKQTAEPSVTEYADYPLYVQEMDKMFGNTGQVDVSVNRTQDQFGGTRESLTITRAKSNPQGKPKRPPAAKSPQFVVSKTLSPVRGAVARNVSSRSNNDLAKAGRARQDFEEISRRVIESTPDKTVTISTWRENVAQEAMEPAVETMSVYYVTGDMDSPPMEDRYDHGGDFSGPIQSTPIRPPPIMIERSMVEPPPPPRPRQEESYQERSNEGHSTTLARETSSGTRVQESEPPGERSRAAPSWIRPSQYGYVPPKAESLQPSTPSTKSRDYFSSPTDDHSPSQFPPTPPPKPPKFPRGKQGPMQSTPIHTHYDDPSFHPTRDGSPITSIKSSEGDQSPHGPGGLDQVLSTCRPSLAHLTPALARLGITTKEHLWALADLDAETRDRELKEEALKNGFTIMEWAILVNRLKTL